MKTGTGKLRVVALLAWLLLPGQGDSQLRSIPLKGPATNLSSVTYYEPPHELVVKYRVTGSEMIPLPGAEYGVKQLRIEMYSEDGSLKAVVETPECVYSPLDNTVSSPGHLIMRMRGGQVCVEGDGFLWQQGSNSLYISNNVSTVIHAVTNLTLP